tara:strand:+ start:272 stop:448 length:177 start_codon:yes stop_codon:yes gene_type:complete
MTRKHFQKIAAIIAKLPREIRNEVALTFAHGLKNENPNFKLDVFIEASCCSDRKRIKK